ncbi:unnamed protein product [Protopolystoma xenopodis]|uniref:Secreted protein n=1 Tax=Protopolystoma xenopodis TaxID=117903 RepID=A0A3S5AJ13_9PLAT|nr:unnamed protein product [Protopolystoma xenopodis]
MSFCLVDVCLHCLLEVGMTTTAKDKVQITLFEVSPASRTRLRGILAHSTHCRNMVIQLFGCPGCSKWPVSSNAAQSSRKLSTDVVCNVDAHPLWETFPLP